MGIGDWGLGIGDWGLGIGPNAQSPIPNPHSRKRIVKCLFRRVLLLNKIFVNSYIIFTIFIYKFN